MRRLYFLFSLLGTFTLAHAQPGHSDAFIQQRLAGTQGFSYSFSFTDEGYQPLQNAIDLNEGLTWDNPTMAISLGFSLRFFEVRLDTLYLLSPQEGKFLALGARPEGQGPISLIYGADLVDRGQALQGGEGLQGSRSPILLKQLGEVGQRKTILEFRNAGFKADLQRQGKSVDYVNFQIHILEESSDIELHMGPSRIMDPKEVYEGKSGPAIGLITQYDLEKDLIQQPGMWLTGFPAIPGVLIAGEMTHLHDTIPSNMVYQFQRMDIETAVEQEGENFSMYPNPARDFIQVDLGDNKKAQVSIFNLQGQLVEQKKERGSMRIHLSHLRRSAYLLRVEVEGEKARYRRILLR